ncbi:hypothetical protein H696_06241 [Fonticula alba]|uniref:RING-type domain-containing protein n=1 Tax=Fonticula alba TaxID=691883 RepID=A0A058Z1C8_FONAL|nr:hypothetical protein H696_06241 [Fonticula alba]KCV67332.1 hypothetical protein H696_06241 [Fonticula alba]|eukprot:XP_009498264.1 hypothetical protein H696_06241 [Fonticula alba]
MDINPYVGPVPNYYSTSWLQILALLGLSAIGVVLWIGRLWKKYSKLNDLLQAQRLNEVVRLDGLLDTESASLSSYTSSHFDRVARVHYGEILRDIRRAHFGVRLLSNKTTATIAPPSQTSPSSGLLPPVLPDLRFLFRQVHPTANIPAEFGPTPSPQGSTPAITPTADPAAAPGTDADAYPTRVRLFWYVPLHILRRTLVPAEGSSPEAVPVGDGVPQADSSILSSTLQQLATSWASARALFEDPPLEQLAMASGHSLADSELLLDGSTTGAHGGAAGLPVAEQLATMAFRSVEGFAGDFCQALKSSSFASESLVAGFSSTGAVFPILPKNPLADDDMDDMGTKLGRLSQHLSRSGPVCPLVMVSWSPLSTAAEVSLFDVPLIRGSLAATAAATSAPPASPSASPLGAVTLIWQCVLLAQSRTVTTLDDVFHVGFGDVSGRSSSSAMVASSSASDGSHTPALLPARPPTTAEHWHQGGTSHRTPITVASPDGGDSAFPPAAGAPVAPDYASNFDLPPWTEDDSECVVCLSDIPTVILLPCRHLSVCRLCFKELDKCPVCRSTISSYLLLETPEATSQTVPVMPPTVQSPDLDV